MQAGKAKTAPDREIRTLRTIVDSLESLPRDASRRVVDYLVARYQTVISVRETPVDRLMALASSGAYPGGPGHEMRLVNKS